MCDGMSLTLCENANHQDKKRVSYEICHLGDVCLKFQLQDFTQFACLLCTKNWYASLAFNEFNTRNLIRSVRISGS